MITLKKHLKQEDIDSKFPRRILKDYCRKDLVKIALYFLRDCSEKINNLTICIELIEKWLNGEEVSEQLKNVAIISLNKTEEFFDLSDSKNRKITYEDYCIHSAICLSISVIFSEYVLWNNIDNIISYLTNFIDDRESKIKEYFDFLRLLAYEDLDFPYKDFSKTFNFDNTTDLNIFLDFLTDNYPTAITYPREEYFENKLAKEYLRILYQ